jgi:hypothetical protein
MKQPNPTTRFRARVITATQVVPELRGRTMLQLSKQGGNTIYLGADDTVSPTNGYIWDGFDPISLPTDGPLYAIVAGDGSNPSGVTSWASVSP